MAPALLGGARTTRNGTQWDTFDKLDKLSDRDFKSLLGHARHVGLTAFSTPFDDEAVDFLASLDVPAFKIASADLTCHGLIERAARVGKPMILSTGTATLAEVEEALEVCRRAGNERGGAAALHAQVPLPAGGHQPAHDGAPHARVPRGAGRALRPLARHQRAPGRGGAGRLHGREALHGRQDAARLARPPPLRRSRRR